LHIVLRNAFAYPQDTFRIFRVGLAAQFFGAVLVSSQDVSLAQLFASLGILLQKRGLNQVALWFSAIADVRSSFCGLKGLS